MEIIRLAEVPPAQGGQSFVVRTVPHVDRQTNGRATANATPTTATPIEAERPIKHEFIEDEPMPADDRSGRLVRHRRRNVGFSTTVGLSREQLRTHN